MSYWNNFVTQFFSARGVFRISLWYIGTDPTNEDHTDKQYEITHPALARYFHTHFESGIRRINLTFERGIIDKPLLNGCHFIENQKASMTYWFDNSHVSHMKYKGIGKKATNCVSLGGCDGNAAGAV